MKRMLSYRTVSLARTGICSGIHPMVWRTTPHQSPASLIRTLTTSSPQGRTYTSQPEAMDYINIRTELKARAAAFTGRNTNLDAYKKSRYALHRTVKQAKRQYSTEIEPYYTGADTRQMSRIAKVNSAESCPVTQACQMPSMLALRQATLNHA